MTMTYSLSLTALATEPNYKIDLVIQVVHLITIEKTKRCMISVLAMKFQSVSLTLLHDYVIEFFVVRYEFLESQTYFEQIK